MKLEQIKAMEETVNIAFQKYLKEHSPELRMESSTYEHVLSDGSTYSSIQYPNFMKKVFIEFLNEFLDR